jgi:predicted dehydrogenase/nucleoside-diphosphate-sugar epimerase
LKPSTRSIRIAVVGCGAIAKAHARAISATRNARLSALFDVDSARAESLRVAYSRDARLAGSYSEVAELADAAIVAVPNVYHAEVTKSLLREGMHVLCEKPLAISSSDAREMVSVAREVGRVLACGLVRRFFGSTALATRALQQGIIGRPLGFEVHESVWNWPMSRAAFDRRASGGGALIDLAPHIFDLLEVWLGPLEIVEYLDDNHGGVEAVALIKARSRSAGGDVSGEVFLSRAYRAVNRTRIICERGYIDVDPHKIDSITVGYKTGPDKFVMTARADADDPFAGQLNNFIAAIEVGEDRLETASSAVKAIESIESCYRMRQPLPEPWTVGLVTGSADPSDAWPAYEKILVTGAAGSVGSRLVEMWAGRGCLDQLRCMARGYRTAARIMRFPADLAEADLLDRAAVMKAAHGCDAIIHLGVGEKAERETQIIVDVARELGIRRFVHLSTAAVYGRSIPKSVEELQEDTKVVRTGEPYADQKARAEQVVINACGRGLEGVILRPHIVYGPGLRWSAELMALLAEGKIPILEDGGWLNLIYIDDLVEAIRLALAARGGFGRPMFITDGAPLRWSQYIAAHASLIGAGPELIASRDVTAPDRNRREWFRDSISQALPVFKSDEFRSFVFESPAGQSLLLPAYLKIRNWSVVRPYVEKMRAGRDAFDANGLAGKRFDETWTALQLSEARLSSSRAEALLGFRARADFSEGLRRAAMWLALYNYDTRSSL